MILIPHMATEVTAFFIRELTARGPWKRGSGAKWWGGGKAWVGEVTAWVVG
jgi:hypothetical protein